MTKNEHTDYDQLCELCIQFGWEDPSIPLEYYDENHGKSLNYILGGLASTNSTLERATKYDTDKFMQLLKQVYERKRKNPVAIPVLLTDIIYIDENGKERIDQEKLTLFIEENNDYKCITDTQELLIYSDGIYIDEEGYLDRFLQQYLFSKATIRFKSEIRKQIKDRNPLEREEINEDKTRIPVINGLLNLDTHLLEPFTEEKVYTSRLNAAYDREATAPEFLKFISEILPAEEIPVVQEMFGYCLWQAYPAAKTFWAIGEGGNGKTVLTSVLAALLNSVENVSHISLNEMSGNNRFAGYELYGKFANVIPEPSTTHMLETPFLKAITGESPISVEKKGVQKRVHFTNFAKIIIEANNIPRIADEKAALWDRILCIDFPYTFRGRENEKPEIVKTLITPDSLSGVLNWALDGLTRLRTNNWRFTNSIRQENIKTSMQIQSNPIAAFKDNWLSFGRHAETSAATLYDAYNLFGVLNGTEPLFKAVISKELEEDNRIALHRVRREGGRPYVFQGCELSKKIVCCYGMHQNRPLIPGEFSDLDESAKVEVLTCSVEEYCSRYPEPTEEVQEVVGEKLVIFNTPGLISLYKTQAKQGTIKHMAPQEQEYRNTDTSKEGAPLFLTHISPLEEGVCERCGKQGFLSHELTDDEGAKLLICKGCSAEIEKEICALTPPVFNTTLDERRAHKKELENEKRKNV